MTKLAEKPFALLGVNSNPYDAAKLKEVMAKEQLNWRSTANSDEIAQKWNTPGTQVYYVLDPRGVIRYKWVGSPGERALDSAIAKLLAEKDTPGEIEP